MDKKKVLEWCGKHENLLKAFVMMWLPLLCCMVTCALEGKTISQVSLAASEWNDELFYYKQVEGILSYGFPRGYFGFNESHALKLSFAAWSPVLVFPWIVWGMIFGWNLMAPIYCNIFLMMLAVFLFVVLVKPNIKQLLMLAVLLASFTPMTRFMLSGMPEVTCFAMVTVFLSLAVNYSRDRKDWKLAVMFLMIFLMTLMRPYLLIFIILPAYFWYCRKKLWGLAGTGVVLGVTGGVYVLINHYLGAEYFTPLFDVTWIEKFFTEGILAGIKFTLYKLWDVGKVFAGMTIQGFKTGYHAGTQFAGFLFMLVLLLQQAWQGFRKKNKPQLELHLSLAVCFVGMLAAVLLMYKPIQGGRHLLTFIVAGIIMLCIMETRFYRKGIFGAALFVYLYMVMATDAYEHQVPYVQEDMQQTLAYWEDALGQELVLDMANTPCFDNVVIWTLSDEVEGVGENMKWQELYAVPEGFGISCCEKNFVEEHFNELQSKYLAVPFGGSLDERCQAEGMREIGHSEDVIIYELR
ncbi:MAG: hypothetical protein IJ282_05085 [Lachnospiraceae bacterium]|nr:hypothetical protein [Lachnospiraceae bacterium]